MTETGATNAISDNPTSDNPISNYRGSSYPGSDYRGSDYRRRGLWGHRDLMLLWAGQSVSEIGSAVTTVALPLVAVVLLHASTFQVGLLTAAGTASFLLVALPAGLVVDRVAKRRLMLGCDLARIVIIGSVAAAAAFKVLTMAQLFVVALTSGLATVFFDVAYQSYVPALVDRDQLHDGNGKLGATQSFAQVVGPGLGGGLFGLLKVRVVHVQPAEIGLLISIGSLGGVLGGVLSGRLAKWIGTARIIWFSMLVFGAIPIVMPLTATGWRLVFFPISIAGLTFGAVVYNIAQVSYRQIICPPELLGRMNAAIRWIVWGTLPLGGLLGGVLGSASVFGVRPTLWVSVLGSWAAGFWVLFSPLRGMRDISASPSW